MIASSLHRHALDTFTALGRLSSCSNQGELQIELNGCEARNDNQRTFQIGAAIPQRAIASITKRKIP